MCCSRWASETSSHGCPSCARSLAKTARREPSRINSHALSLGRGWPEGPGEGSSFELRTSSAPLIRPSATFSRWEKALSSQQCPPQDDQRHREVDTQPRDIDECGHEWRGARRRIESQFAQNKRQHAAGKRSECHHADERGPDGEGDEHEVLPILGEVELFPQHDADESDRAEERAKNDAGDDLAPKDPPPVAQPQLVQRESADDERSRLRSGVAAAADDQRDEERQDDSVRNLSLEITHRRRREHLTEEES